MATQSITERIFEMMHAQEARDKYCDTIPPDHPDRYQLGAEVNRQLWLSCLKVREMSLVKMEEIVETKRLEVEQAKKMVELFERHQKSPPASRSPEAQEELIKFGAEINRLDAKIKQMTLGVTVAAQETGQAMKILKARHEARRRQKAAGKVVAAPASLKTSRVTAAFMLSQE